jgi:hypothetical protein
MPVAARIPHERGREREVTGIMRDSAAPAPAPDPNARALLLGALATLALTAAHHAYGAIRYDTPGVSTGPSWPSG